MNECTRDIAEEGPWMADALRIEGAVVDAKNVIAAARGRA